MQSARMPATPEGHASLWDLAPKMLASLGKSCLSICPGLDGVSGCVIGESGDEHVVLSDGDGEGVFVVFAFDADVFGAGEFDKPVVCFCVKRAGCSDACNGFGGFVACEIVCRGFHAVGGNAVEEEISCVVSIGVPVLYLAFVGCRGLAFDDVHSLVVFECFNYGVEGFDICDRSGEYSLRISGNGGFGKVCPDSEVYGNCKHG